MLDHRVRRLISRRAGALLGAVWIAGCASPCAEPVDALGAARAYELEACVRRRAMIDSVAAAETPYGELRLAHYALSGDGTPGDDWDALPLFDQPVRRLRVRDGTAPDEALEEGPVLDEAPADLASYVAAGARAFERYPIQIDLGLSPLRDRATAERTGLTVDEGGLVRGVVEVETSTGWSVSLTCAACHARNDEDGAVVMAPNERLDLGTLFGQPDWPVGTIDVTDDGVVNPIRPSDLRPIALQARLQHTGNLFNGRVARMARIETLMITQLGERFRPPREIAAAIALFLEAEGERLLRPDAGHPGAEAFASSCGGCHRGEGLSGPPVSAESVGTDPVATGGQRGTGGYRAPSLLGVADRRGVFHDGSAGDLRAVLGLSPSEHRGHPFGRELPTGDREAIAAYLSDR